MNKIVINFCFFFAMAVIANAQTKVMGYVTGKDGKPLENVTVTLKPSNLVVKTDKIGYFQYKDVNSGEFALNLFKIGYDEITQDFSVNDEKVIDLNKINMNYNPASADVGIITLTQDELSADESTTQSGIGLLQSSKDAFSRVAAFELGSYWFRPRGNDNRYNDVLFNGVPMSKQDNGRIDFSNWGGLNDITRYPLEVAENINPSDYTFGNLGGTTNFSTRASSFRKGTSLAYSFTNRSYNNRVMLTHHTGMNKKGWAFSVSGSKRWSEEGVIDGQYYDAYAFFGAVEKRINDKHSLNLSVTGAPRRNSSNSPNTQEVYDLAGKNYNAYWGWQDGEKRNERVRKVFEPFAQLTHYWKLGRFTDLNTTVSYQQGEDSRSRLDYFRAANPSPTYYRKLPSYDTNTAAEWLNNRQLDWDALYFANQNTGDYGTGIGGNRAAYALVEDVAEDKTINVNSHLSTKIQDNWKFHANFNYQNLESDNYRRVADLLGADFAVNLNSFGNDGQYDVDNPSFVVREDDRTQYSYLLNRNIYSLNASTELDLDKWNVVLSVFGSHTKSQRDGQFRHHFYQNNSKGESEKFNSTNLGMKTKVTYKLNGKNYLVYNGAYFSLAPTLNEIFPNARSNNSISPLLNSEVINTNDLSFIHRGQVFNLKASAYLTDIKNATEISRFYVEGIGTGSVSNDLFVTEILTGVDKQFKGGELAVEWKITSSLTATGVASYGEYTYSNNPALFLASDEIAAEYQDLGAADIEGMRISRSPQEGYSFGMRYFSPKYWWIGATANYLASSYLDFAAVSRTSNFYTNPATGDNYTGVTQADVDALLTQTKFDDQFMLNASIGKSFRFGEYTLGTSLGVNNILGNRDYITGGFEQARFSNYPEAFEDANRSTPRFGPKLWYDRGVSFFTNIYLRF